MKLILDEKIQHKIDWLQNHINNILEDYDYKILKALTYEDAQALFQKRDEQVKPLRQLLNSLVNNAPAPASIFIDKEEIGRYKINEDISSNNSGK